MPTHTTGLLPERRDCDCHRQPAVVVVFCFLFFILKGSGGSSDVDNKILSVEERRRDVDRNVPTANGE